MGSSEGRELRKAQEIREASTGRLEIISAGKTSKNTKRRTLIIIIKFKGPEFSGKKHLPDKGKHLGIRTLISLICCRDVDGVAERDKAILS